jgi:hypothetical protein
VKRPEQYGEDVAGELVETVAEVVAVERMFGDWEDEVLLREAGLMNS